MNDLDRDAPRYRVALPPLLNEIADCIGRENGGVAVAITIGTQFAGRRLYIPGRMHPDHPLIALLGEKIARKLAQHFDGLTIKVPAALVGGPQRRADAVMELRRRGFSVNDICHKLGLSRSTVQRVAQKHRGTAPGVR